MLNSIINQVNQLMKLILCRVIFILFGTSNIYILRNIDIILSYIYLLISSNSLIKFVQKLNYDEISLID